MDLNQVEALEEVGVLEPEVDFKQFLLPGISCLSACLRTRSKWWEVDHLLIQMKTQVEASGQGTLNRIRPPYGEDDDRVSELCEKATEKGKAVETEAEMSTELSGTWRKATRPEGGTQVHR
ncbi:hypothetical protein FD755_000557 [Muntiacus reevesi]|uniref:Uncharacterized protein n=1 Tax=Muntiacus reevesi TaxID=9886 RepID=A0A5J5MZ38_MUNRE|nr:hypothetical protein FD755_000557 [Muntiacus reevesi]